MEQIDFLRLVIRTLEQMDVTYMLVGSYALNALGEPRFTQDIDIVVKLQPEEVAVMGRAFPPPEFYFDVHTAAATIRSGGMFNVIQPASGNKVDFIIARMDLWGRQQIANRTRRRILADLEGYVARAEDVILSKMLFYKEGRSEKHTRDIASILRVQGDRIDRDYIARWAIDLKVFDVWSVILERLKQD